MKIKIGLVCCWTAILLGLGCGNEKIISPPEGSIPRDTLLPLLVDMHLVEASAAIHLIRGQDPLKHKISMYGGLFAKYKVSETRFKETMLFYHNNPKEADLLYNDVLHQLSTMQSKIATE